MDRRDLLKVAGMASALAIASTACAQHQHGSTGRIHSELTAAASACVDTGNCCLDHCLHVLGTGDTSLAECARSVNELIAVCTALAKLATANSPMLARYAALVKVSCDNCERECRKHERHAECKACADACAACSREIARLA